MRPSRYHHLTKVYFKPCGKCKKVKAVDEFYLFSGRRTNRCMKCIRKNLRMRYYAAKAKR